MSKLSLIPQNSACFSLCTESTVPRNAVCTVGSTIYDIVIKPTETILNISSWGLFLADTVQESVLALNPSANLSPSVQGNVSPCVLSTVFYMELWKAMLHLCPVCQIIYKSLQWTELLVENFVRWFEKKKYFLSTFNLNELQFQPDATDRKSVLKRKRNQVWEVFVSEKIFPALIGQGLWSCFIAH